jgi:hypothetical protein
VSFGHGNSGGNCYFVVLALELLGREMTKALRWEGGKALISLTVFETMENL